jgi:hypothetical protein
MFGIWFSGGIFVNRILNSITYVLAAVYFLVDAVFMSVAKPISNWVAKHLVLRRLRAWIRSLPPYRSLALFSVPVIILEPVKPVAAYLAATGQMLGSALTLIIGELLKLVLVERLFSLTRDKLMKIPTFAWAYGKFRQAKAWLETTRAWQTMRSLSRAAREYVAHLKGIIARRFSIFEGQGNGSRISKPPWAV